MNTKHVGGGVGEVVTKEEMATKYADETTFSGHTGNPLADYRNARFMAFLAGFSAATALHEAEKRRIAEEAFKAARAGNWSDDVPTEYIDDFPSFAHYWRSLPGSQSEKKEGI